LKKKILILGGTIYQFNFIKKLIQKNFEIYLVDNIKSSFAKKYSHNFIKLDLRSDKKLRRIIQFNNINLISSPSSEYGLISELKLKNIIKKNSFNIRKIKMICDKYKFNLLKKKLKMNVGLFSLKKLFLKKKLKF
jgi:UDP-glucose 4-epimerase